MSYGGRGEVTALEEAQEARRRYGTTTAPIGVDVTPRGCPKGVDAAEATLLLLLSLVPSKKEPPFTGVDCAASMAEFSNPLEDRESMPEQRDSNCEGCNGVANPCCIMFACGIIARGSTRGVEAEARMSACLNAIVASSSLVIPLVLAPVDGTVRRFCRLSVGMLSDCENGSMHASSAGKDFEFGVGGATETLLTRVALGDAVGAVTTRCSGPSEPCRLKCCLPLCGLELLIR